MNAVDTKPNWAPKPYTQGQADLIKTMMAERGISTATLLKVFPSRPATFADGSKVVGWLKGLPLADKKCSACGEPKGQLAHPCGLMPKPSQPTAPQAWDDITDGNYALPYNGKTHFYRVSRREGKGKWAGRTFVNVQERASDELYRVPFKRGLAIMHSIREYGVEASHKLFSEVMDQCWHCTKSIGDEDNPYKVHGLGPVCGPKIMG